MPPSIPFAELLRKNGDTMTLLHTDWNNYQPLPTTDYSACAATYMALFRNLATYDNSMVDLVSDSRLRMSRAGNIIRLLEWNDIPDQPFHSKENTMLAPAGWQLAISDMKTGDLRYCPEDQHYYVRDSDTSVEHSETDLALHPLNNGRLLLNSWHQISNLQAEYNIKYNSNDDRPALARTILFELQRTSIFPPIHVGVRIGNSLWMRTASGISKITTTSTEIAVTQNFDYEPTYAQLAYAYSVCHWLTADNNSCDNLIRMFATPWLEQQKMSTYILSGDGGDGKSLLCKWLIENPLGHTRVYPSLSITTVCAPSSYDLARVSAVHGMNGKAFAIDDEMGVLEEAHLPFLRILSSGGTVQGRAVGRAYEQVTPTATIVACTNNPIPVFDRPADMRRFVLIQMHSNKGRNPDAYHNLELSLHEPSFVAAFYYLSCEYWRTSHPCVGKKVTFTPHRNIDDETSWLISMLMDDSNGVFCSRFQDEFRHKASLVANEQFGIRTSNKRVTINGIKTRARMYVIDDPERFAIGVQAITERDHTYKPDYTAEDHIPILPTTDLYPSYVPQPREADEK